MNEVNGKLMCPKCNGLNVLMIEYGYGGSVPIEHQYDGISEYRCQECGYREGRWSHRQLVGEDDYERKYGE